MPNGNSEEPPTQPPPGSEPQAVANLNIVLMNNGQVGVSYPKDLRQAFFLLGEGVKILGQELLRQSQPPGRIVVPGLITPRILKGK